MNQNEVFNTPDLTIAATLYYLGFQLEKLEKIDLHKVTFVFKRTPELDQTVSKFWLKELRVEPAGFLLSLRQLKSYIRSVQ